MLCKNVTLARSVKTVTADKGWSSLQQFPWDVQRLLAPEDYSGKPPAAVNLGFFLNNTISTLRTPTMWVKLCC